MREFSVVTGAFSYTGRYIAERLLAMGQPVRTLTRHPPSVSDSGIEVAPLNFADRDGLVDALRGATTLYNTYWVRFPRGWVTFEQAVANSQSLFEAAGIAGVRRLVHISVTNPSATSPLPYFKGKGKVEEALARSGLSYAIIRPTLIYGLEDVLLNNIAWFLRRLPVFGIPGNGSYRVQPVSVEDVADLAVFAATQKDNLVMDAVGPEIYTFDALVRALAEAVGSHVRIAHVSPALAMLAVGVAGRVVRDVVLTRDELRGLMENLLVSNGPPTGRRRLSEWLAINGESLGRRYANELKRNYR